MILEEEEGHGECTSGNGSNTRENEEGHEGAMDETQGGNEGGHEGAMDENEGNEEGHEGGMDER